MADPPTHRIRARVPKTTAGDFRRLNDADEIAPFLTDAANYPGGETPQVCFPENEADVAAILAEGRPVLVAGAQSSLTGGATPRGETLISTAKMAAIGLIEIAAEGASVTVGPGVVLRELIEVLRGEDLYYPPVPTYDGATVGGTVATNAAGAATFKYGTTRDWVEAITVVLADGDVIDLRRGELFAHQQHFFEVERAGARAGEIVRVELPKIEMPKVPKISAGYFSQPGMDLIDLFIGSEGTLGVVTEVTLRLVSPIPQWFVVLVPLYDEGEALSLSAELREAARGDCAGVGAVDIAAIEYLDARSLELVCADGADTRLGLVIAQGTGAAILIQLELDASMTREQACEEIAELEDETIDTPLLRVCRILEQRDLFESALAALPGEDAKRTALFALREAVPEAVNARIRKLSREVDPTISKAAADVIVPFEHLAEALLAYRTIAEKAGLDVAIWGHISDGNLHPNFLPTNADEMARAHEALREIGRAAIRLNGSPMSEHGVGRNEAKKQLLPALYGREGVDAMREVKRALDPAGLLAPGVLF